MYCFLISAAVISSAENISSALVTRQKERTGNGAMGWLWGGENSEIQCLQLWADVTVQPGLRIYCADRVKA